MVDVTETTVSQRIKSEFPPESRSKVYKVYQYLKIKENEGHFLKILDDAKGDADKVKKLASVVESVGWQAFLENHW